MRLQIASCVILFFILSEIQTFAAIEIAIDGKFDDWAQIPVLIEDPDDIEEDNGDIKSIRVHSTEDTIYIMATVYGEAAPVDAQRYYYHTLIDADNDIKTGFNNSEYEGIPTGVKNPIGADFYVQIGRRNGADDGIEVHFLTANTDETVSQDFPWMAGGDSMEISVPFTMFNALQNIGDIFKPKQIVMIAAFQEGSANDWEVDWTESAEHKISVPASVEFIGKLSTAWSALKRFQYLDK